MKFHFSLGLHDVVHFTASDAVRFLNGQLTQDVRKVADGESAVFSCVTDAKGRLQFRVVITADGADTILVAVPAGMGEALEARLTRYLIADNVEVSLTPVAIDIHHFTGDTIAPASGIIARSINRFGEPGQDWWLPTGNNIEIPGGFCECTIEEMETLRITRGIPAWNREITEGILPPEAGLENTDISYQKGCYIGQEVISRIKSAGKVNRILTRFEIDDAAAESGPIRGADGKEIGVVTSIAPISSPGIARAALGFIKRNANVEHLMLGGAAIRAI